MREKSNFVRKMLSRKPVRKYYCPSCGHSWETDVEYSCCPLCASEGVQQNK